jgi:hypothetical protein
LAPTLMPAGAQSVPSTPEEVVRDFFRAERTGRWLDAARLLDLARFEPILRSSLDVPVSRTSPARITAQELMRNAPDMPLAVAEYQARKMRETVSDVDFLARDFARVPTVDSLRELPLDEAAARWLEAKGPRWRIELGRRESKRHPETQCPELPDSIAAALTDQFSAPTARILGITGDSDSVRYAVIGPAFGNQETGNPGPMEVEFSSSPTTLVLRKLNGAWKIVPALDMPNARGVNGMMDSFVLLTCTPQRSSK